MSTLSYHFPEFAVGAVVTVRVPGDEEMVIRLLACSPEPIPPWRDSTD